MPVKGSCGPFTGTGKGSELRRQKNSLGHPRNVNNTHSTSNTDILHKIVTAAQRRDRDAAALGHAFLQTLFYAPYAQQYSSFSVDSCKIIPTMNCKEQLRR